MRALGKWLDVQAALQRERWYRNRNADRDDLANRRLRLHESVWNEHVQQVEGKPLNEDQIANYLRAVRVRMRPLNREYEYLRFLGGLGRLIDKWFLLHLTHRFVRLVDVTLAVSLFGFSLFTVFGISLKAAFDVDVTQVIIRLVTGGPHLPPTPPPPPTSRGPYAETVIARTLFPEDRIPIFWTLGLHGSNDLNRGFDRVRISTSDFHPSDAACNAKEIVAVGTASREGDEARNQLVARARANTLALRAMEILSSCPNESRPRVTAMAMYVPTASVGDGSQRRAFVVALSFSDAGADATPDRAARLAGASVDRAVGDQPENFRRHDLCIIEGGECNAWRPLS